MFMISMSHPPGKQPDGHHSFVQDHKTGLAVAGGVAAVGLVAAGAYAYHEHEEEKKQNASLTHLNILLISGHELLAKDFGGTSDPYVVFKQGHCSVKSKVINKNLNPIWNEQLKLAILDVHKELHIIAYDKDFANDDCLGKTVYSLATLTPNPQEVILKLKGDGGLFEKK